MVANPVSIAGRPIGPEHPPYIVAELSANHNGDIERAFDIIAAAQEAGADAVKLQTYTADTITIDHDGPDFRIKGGLWDGRLLYELYNEAHTPFEWHEALFAKARELGITMFSSPFDPTAIDLLAGLDAPAYKIASFEAVDPHLIRRAAATGKPLIVSTGMAGLGEIEEAVTAARAGGDGGLVLLHCVSAYPAPAAEINLRTIPHLAQAFGVPAGLSDHTMGTHVAVAAVAMGACLIEKHFTLRRADGGPDSTFSLEPRELRQLVRDTSEAWAALGSVSYAREASEAGNLAFRRSLYAVRDIAAGETFTADNVRIIRPGFGLAPRHLDQVLGARAATAVPRGTAITWRLVR